MFSIFNGFRHFRRLVYSTFLSRFDRVFLLDLKAFHEPSELLPGYGLELIFRARPLELSALQPLVQEHESVVLPHESFDAVSLPPAEQEQCRLERIHVEVFVYQCYKTVYGLTHVGIAAGYIYLIDNSDVT